MLQIDWAKENDIPELVNLLTILFTQDIEFEPNKEKQTSGLRTIIQNPNIGRILILKKDNEVIGMLNILFSVSTALGSFVAIFEDMVVLPEYRKMGHGKMLLNEGLQRAMELGCQRVTLLTDYNNDSAIAFYQNSGFVKSAMIPMRKII